MLSRISCVQCRRVFNKSLRSTPSLQQQAVRFFGDGQRKTALVLGSSGALGSCASRYLSKECGMQVIGADVVELPGDFTLDWELDGFIHLPPSVGLGDHMNRLLRGVHVFLHGKPGLDLILCASGGWQPDTPTTVDTSSEQAMEENAAEYAARIVSMRRMNLDPVIAAGYIAQYYMAQDGLFVAIGAAAALSPTPGMMAYGLAKAASHHFIQTLGACTGKSIETKSIRTAGSKVRQNLPSLDTMTVVGILPSTIDTAANRHAMPNANFDNWTKPLDIAKEIGKWVNEPVLRPHSGSLVNVVPNSKGPGAIFELMR